MLQRLLFILTLLLSGFAHAQHRWVWAGTDAGISYDINPSYPRQVVAAHNGQALWGVIQNRKLTFGQVMLGDYRLIHYNASGAALASTSITGKVSLTAARADAAGNWYILGFFYDSVRLSNGMSLVRGTTDGEHFLMRLRAGSLAPDWLVPVGSNYYCGTECFTISGGDIYLPVDSSYGTAICRYNTGTGARTTLWNQTGRSYTSFIDADAAGNIYLMGNCVLAGGINFNGVAAVPPSPGKYPWFIARYKRSGQHHWHHWLTDITCLSRSLKLGGSNAVYLTGALLDSTTLGSFQFSRHSSPSYTDLIMARLDSNGSLIWAQQRPVTSITQGPLSFGSQYHMAVADTMLYMYCQTQGPCIWGNGVFTQTKNNRMNGTIVAYGASGVPQWAKTVSSNYSLAQHIVSDGSGLWVTGVGADSNAIGFDSMQISSASVDYIPYIAQMNLRQSPPASVLRPALRPALSAWPNPAKKQLQIRSDEAQSLVIRDLTGRIVWSRRNAAAGTVMTIDISSWSRGVYLLQSKGPSGGWVTKLSVD